MIPFLALILAAWSLNAQPARERPGDTVLLVVNSNSAVSRQIADYYRPRRSIPIRNVCYLSTTSEEAIDWNTYRQQIETPVGNCLKKAGLVEKALYIVTTLGVPLKITGGGSALTAEYGSVDSELALLYGKLKGAKFERMGPVRNPFFMQRDGPFRHPSFPIYLVTRLAGYDFADVKGMIDRSLAARNRGKFVIDAGPAGIGNGNSWLRAAAMLLPPTRVNLDVSAKVLYGQKQVIAYAGWGSNDIARKQRWLGYEWLPGAIALEFVSTNGRTFRRPPDDWVFSSGKDWGGSRQDLAADLIHEGATGASANVYEPLIDGCARPEYVLPAYFEGRNLAESFYMGLPYLSWQGIVLGDPLCFLGKP